MARNVRAADRGSEQGAIEALRRRLAPTAPRPGEARQRAALPTGLAPLDEALGGGLPRGRIVEAVGRAGRMSLALPALAAATAAGHLAALVDGPGALDTRALQAAGADLGAVLWCQPREVQLVAALRVADALLDSDAFALVVLYAADVPGRAGAGAWLRLQQRAARAGAAVLILGDGPLCGSFSAATVELARAAAGWRRAPGGRLVLAGRRLQLCVARSRLGPTGAESLALHR